MKKTVLKTLAFLALAALLVPAAFAQCVSNVPSQIDVGHSYCIRVCEDAFAYPAILLYGNRDGIGAVPVLTLHAGCNAANTDCDVQCTAITPPAYPFVLGGDHFYPENYYGHSDCFDMYLYWVHDNVWALEIYTLCSGCFCLSFDGQLAVNLSTDLTATAGDNAVTLDWATASETSNDHFDVMRDGQLSARIEGLGNSTTGREYTWTDNSAVNGVMYQYQLVSVDANGNSRIEGRVAATPTASSPAQVTEYALLQNYPNPFNPTTSITFDVLEANHVTLKVFNPMGQCVATLVNANTAAGRHSVSFNGQNLTSGLYFYSITIGDRFSATRKMLLVK
ncbi:MAG TPA: T9SS type A sorting domain-containing protein [bacterium]